MIYDSPTLLIDRVKAVLELRNLSTDPRTKVAAAMFSGLKIVPDFYGANANTCIDTELYEGSVSKNTDLYGFDLCKYDVTTHAEALCLDMWKMDGFRGANIYTFICTHYPCLECMKAIITAIKCYGLCLTDNTLFVLPYSTVTDLGRIKAETLAKVAGIKVHILKGSYIPGA